MRVPNPCRCFLLEIIANIFSELNRIRDGISELEAFLRTALKNLDNVEATESLQAPTNIPDVLRPCLNVAIGICDKCSQGKRLFHIIFKLQRNEPPRGKTNNVVSEQVQHKPT